MSIIINNREYKKVDYEKDLKSRQKENYNFAILCAVLANYGFTVMLLSDDWQGADCIAQHVDGETFIKIQLKSRFGFARKYRDKNLYVAFRCEDHWYLYPHDKLLELDPVARNHVRKHNAYSCKRPSQKAILMLERYKI